MSLITGYFDMKLCNIIPIRKVLMIKYIQFVYLTTNIANAWKRHSAVWQMSHKSTFCKLTAMLVILKMLEISQVRLIHAYA